MISIAVDFDGTLVEDKFPDIGKEKSVVVDLIKELQYLGARTILWTCRKGVYLDEAVQWCKDHGLNFVCVNENLPEVQKRWGGDTRKVMADIYIDDKNLDGLSMLSIGRLVNKLKMKESGV